MKIKLKIPESLSEIKLWQYQKFLKIQEENTDEKFLASKMLEIFCEAELKETFFMKMKDIAKVSKIINKIFEEKPTLIREFKMNETNYGFIPNLDEMTLGEYIDLDTYISDWQQMEKAMAVLYRPIELKLRDKYKIVEYTAIGQEKMKEMPLDVVFSSILFFYHLGIDLSRVMMSYSVETPISSQPSDNFLISGDGMLAFTDSLKAILDDLKISLN